MTRRKLIILSGLLSVCVLAVYFLYPTDRKRIISVINDCEEAVVSGDIDAFMKNVSYNYLDDNGYGYLQVKRIMEQVFGRIHDIDIDRNIRNVSIRNGSASAALSLRVLASEGTDRGYVIGDAAGTQTVTVQFKKSLHKWLITGVRGVFKKDSRIQRELSLD